MAIGTINETSESTPQQGHRKKRRRNMTRDQRVERQISDSLHFKDPAKYQEWLNTPAYNKRGPLTQKQDEWLWGFTGADCFGKVDWAKCAHLYFQLFNEKRTAERLQMEWFRISRNKKNESGHGVTAQGERNAPSYQEVVIPKHKRSARNARNQSAAVNVIRSPKITTAATQVTDPTKRETTKRRRETSDDGQHFFYKENRDLHSKRSVLGPETADHDRQEPLPIRIGAAETFDIREIVSCTAATKLTKPLVSLMSNQDQSPRNNTGISLDIQKSSAQCLVYNPSRGGCSSVDTNESFGYEEKQKIKQANDNSTGTALATHHPTAPSIKVASGTPEDTSDEEYDLFKSQDTVMQYCREVSVAHGLQERNMRRVESTGDMFHYGKHNPHKSSTVTQITNHSLIWAREETDTPQTTTSVQELSLGPANSAEEAIVQCEAVERLRKALEPESNVGFLLDPELLGIPALPKGPLDPAKADAHNQVPQQAATEKHLLGHLPTQNLIMGINLTNPSQSRTFLSGFEKSLKRILQTLLATPLNQDIVIATESDYTIWSVTTSYPTQQVSSEPESESNGASTKVLIERVRAIIRGREIAGSKTEFE